MPAKTPGGARNGDDGEATAAPMPAKAARIRESAVERVLKAHPSGASWRPRFCASRASPRLPWRPGTAEAATAHIRVLAERLKHRRL